MLHTSVLSGISHPRSKTLLKVVSGIALFFGCTQFSIPLQPVPITLQTICALFIGYTFSSREATATLASFLTLGAVGLPVFASYSAGFSVLLGPRGGYLFGFLIAARFIAQFQKDKPSLTRTLSLGVMGLSIIYGLGILWLTVLFGFHEAIMVGLWPFVVIEPIKLAFLGITMHAVRFVRQGFRD